MLTPTHLTLAGLVLTLTGIASYYTVRQIRNLRGLAQRDLQPEDHRHFRRQAWLRLANSGLMFLLAALLGWTYLSGQEGRIDARLDGVAAAEPGKLSPEELDLRRSYLRYWGVVLVVLFTIVMLATIDFWQTHRYGRRHLKQIQADHRAALEQDLAELRRRRLAQRNGHAESSGNLPS